MDNKRKKREPKSLNCIILNPIETIEEQEIYDDLIFKALATSLSRCFNSRQIDDVISQLEGVK